MEKPKNPARIEEVRELNARGPWTTKSGGTLNVAVTFPFDIIQLFINTYDEGELKKIPEDIRGFRIYTVRNLPIGRVGGTEFHRIRREIAFGLEGRIRWECEDLYGKKKEFIMTPKTGLVIPPSIIHTYEVLEDKSGIFAVANTLFNADDPRTHDTYSHDSFCQLQKNYV